MLASKHYFGVFGSNCAPGKGLACALLTALRLEIRTTMGVEVALRVAFVQVVQHGRHMAARELPTTFRATEIGLETRLVIVP